jgi:hypothetical protein
LENIRVDRIEKNRLKEREERRIKNGTFFGPRQTDDLVALEVAEKILDDEHLGGRGTGRGRG